MKRPPLQLDFVAGTQAALWPGLLLLAVALAVVLALGLQYRATQHEIERLSVVQGLIAPAASTTAARGGARDARAEEQAKDAQAAVRQLALPWAALIATLENATSKDVAMLQVQPEAQQQVLRITAEARDHKAMLAYIAKLQGDPLLSNVHWINHLYQNDDPQRPLQFSLQAGIRVAR